MASSSRLAFVASGSLLAGIVVWLLLEREPAPELSGPGTTTEVSVADPASADLDVREQPVGRQVVAKDAPDEAALAHPFAYELEILVQDRTGLPCAGARVLLAPPGCRLDEVPERTDDDGLVRVRWLGRKPAMPMIVATTRDEVRESMRQVMVQSGGVQRLLLGGRVDQGGPTFRLVSSGGGGSGQAFSFVLGDGKGGDGDAVLRNFLQAAGGVVAQRGAFQDNPQLGGGLHPSGSFVDVQWKKREEPAPGAGAGAGEALSIELSNATVQWSVAAVDGSPPQPAGSPAKLAGTVYGEDGKPSPRCPVVWGKRVDRAAERTMTDDQGRFEFDDVPEGALELRAGGARGGLQHQTVHTLRGQTTTVQVNLRREAHVRGRAVDAEGKPLAGWRLEWVGTQTPWYDACTVSDDGTWLMTNLPGGTGQVLLFRGEGPSRLPAMILGNVLPDGTELVVRFDASTARGELRLEPALPDGVDKAAVEVRVFQEDTARGTTLQKLKDTNQFAISGLMAGWYRLELGGPGLGWLDCGRHFVDGQGKVDLGRVNLLGTGNLRLPEGVPMQPTGEEQGPVFEIWRRRDDVDVRIADLTGWTGEPLPLPPGDYFALWRGQGETKGFAPFRVLPGQDVLVQAPLRDVQGAAIPSGPAPERR